jgi:subtilisin family serine protease
MTLQKQLEYSNIPAWHEAGYTGRGINVMNLETPGGHGSACSQRVKDAAPDATVYETGLSSRTENGEYIATCKYDGKTYTLEEFIKEYKIRLVIRSTGGRVKDEIKSAFWQRLIDKYNVILVTPSGNEGVKRITSAFPKSVAIYVGACGLSDSGVVKVKNYSGRGEEVDFVNFTGNLEGTSFAAPYTAGMIALLLQKNPNMTWLEAKEYLKMHSKDLETDGHDINTGWGVPVMGKPEIMITMWIGKNYMSVDGRQVTLDQAPQIVKETGRTLVPIRAIAEALGAKVEWDEKTKKITIVR